MNALRVSAIIIWLTAAVMVGAFTESAVGLLTDSDPVGGNTFATAASFGGSVGILDAWTTGTTHPVSAGTDRLLLVGVYGEDSGVISSVNTVTWGGQTLTEINEATVGSGYSNLVWMGYLNDAGIAAASGSTIVATWSGATPDESVLYAAVTLEDVNQTTPVGGSSTGTSTSASTVQIASSLSVDTSDMAVYVTVSGEQGQTHAADTGYTEGTEQDSGGVGQVASNATKAITASGSEQPTATWTGTNNRLAIIGTVIRSSPLPGAVGILDAWTTGTTHTVSAGTDRLLLVGVYGEDSGVISSVNTVTWGGQTLTEINEAMVGTGPSNVVWMGYLNEAGIAAGSGSTIVATWSGSTPNRSILYAAATLQDVDQTTPVGGSSTGTTTNASTIQTASSLGTVAGDMAAYLTVSSNAGQTHTADTGYTEGTEEDSGGTATDHVAANATKAIAVDGSEQPTATWTGTNVRLGIIGAVIKGSPLPGSVGILDAWTTGTTHTVSAGTDRLLLVGVYGEDSGVINSVNTVTWGGQTLTEINEATVGGGYSNLVWMGYLNDADIAAASGSTIVATWSGATPSESVLYAAVTLENVDQTTPAGGSSTGTNTSASTVQIASSLSVDTSDMAVYVAVSGEQGQTHTADTGYTEGTEQDSGGVGQVASNATKAIIVSGSEQPTATWSNTNNRLAIIGAVINVAP